MKLKMEVFAQLKKLHPQAVLIVSNQGGIELGHVHPAMFQPKFIYVIACLQSYIGLNTLVAGQFCPYNDKKHPKRKPNPGMLEDMLAEFTHNTGITISKEDCLMIGDASGLEGQFSATHKGTALVTVMPEQIQSPSMTADWEEKLLLIEKGEYASEDFMDEIKDVIAGLIQNYEVIRDSEVLMSKEANSIGKCPLCGSAVEDKSKGYFCSNRGCSFALWKNNRYFASIGKSMTSATAQKLLGSGKVKLKNCKSERTGNTFDATVFMEVSDDGKTKFSMEFENGGKRK